MNRLDKAWKILRQGKVRITLNEEHIRQARVESEDNSKKEYGVRCVNDKDWDCDCEDYLYNYMTAKGSYQCKHILAMVFKIAELKGVESQTRLKI